MKDKLSFDNKVALTLKKAMDYNSAMLQLHAVSAGNVNDKKQFDRFVKRVKEVTKEYEDGVAELFKEQEDEK